MCAMVKEKGTGLKTLSAYPLTDQPLGSSLPYVPQARPWDARALTAPPLGEGRDPSSRLGTGVSRQEIEARKDELDVKKAGAEIAQRPTASVTEIHGASAPPKRLGQKTKGQRQRVVLDGDKAFLEREADVQHFTFPAILWCAVGCFFPPALCCGLRFTGSANAVAKFFGWASIFLLSLYIATGMILYAQFAFDDKWSGTDPGCLRFVESAGGQTSDFTKNEYGRVNPIFGLPGPGMVVTSNVSIMEVNCSFMAQVVIDADEAQKRDRTLVVRMQTPGTTGDNFGLYVRDRKAKINPSTDDVPAKAWFEETRPIMSNPESITKQNNRGTCKRGMCDGVYGNSLPAIAGSLYEARVQLGWYKYFIAIAVFANDALALERPFCVDTCLLPNLPSTDPKDKRSVDPCTELKGGTRTNLEISSCKAAIDSNCVFAKTRQQCLGMQRRRRPSEEDEDEEDAGGKSEDSVEVYMGGVTRPLNANGKIRLKLDSTGKLSLM